MSCRLTAFIGAVLALMLVSLAQQSVFGQVPSSPKPAAWIPPRTPDGHPDLQGFWTNATITPFERPSLVNLGKSSF
jgi:hypothetical protein